jgi:hypothetical protein
MTIHDIAGLVRPDITSISGSCGVSVFDRQPAVQCHNKE